MALIPRKPTSESDKKATQQAATEDVLLREVDEAVRQDQYANFAKTYGKLMIAIVVIGLGAFAGYLYWQNKQQLALEQRSETLVSALDQIEAGNLTTGDTTLTGLIADSGSDGGVRAAARMLKAGVAMEQGKDKEAADIYAAVIADKDTPDAVRKLATIRQVSASFDTLKPDAVIAKLEPLAVPGQPFFGNAGELVAMAYLEQGDRAKAGSLFASIAKDTKVPDTLRSRSRQMAGLLGVDAIEDVDKVLEETTRPAANVPPAPQ